jgi:hypothetical protein
MSQTCPVVEGLPHGTICKCGIAKSYHGSPYVQPLSEYEPRYTFDRLDVLRAIDEMEKQ